MMKTLACILILLVPSAVPAGARTICTIIAEAPGGEVLFEQGDCRSRVTPASTFKIPLALMGFDSGYLSGLHAPRLPFRQGYADWGGTNWTQATDPERWMKHSVLWYSRHITAALGTDAFAAYTRAYGYGNADVSGDSGQDNGLERSWIASSLKISPAEQVDFLRRLLSRKLPASPQAVAQTLAIIETSALPGGWTVSGKTGAAYPRRADGSFDRARSWGWFVGWAGKGDRSLIFARLNQDEKREKGSAGIRAKREFLRQWPGIASGLR